MSTRLYVPGPLAAGLEFDLPPGPARHVQVRRLQPGDALVLFDGRGGEWAATVLRMGRQDVAVAVGAHDAVEREAAAQVALALGVPANERMDWLVEKATELGVAAIHPLITERSVLRLSGERAERRRQHWQAIAEAAAEQCGRTRVPAVAPLRAFAEPGALPEDGPGYLLSLAADSGRGPVLLGHRGALRLLSGPEGGLSPAEQALALAAGWQALTLGPRVLRAETAPLVALALAVSA